MCPSPCPPPHCLTHKCVKHMATLTHRCWAFSADARAPAWWARDVCLAAGWVPCTASWMSCSCCPCTWAFGERGRRAAAVQAPGLTRPAMPPRFSPLPGRVRRGGGVDLSEEVRAVRAACRAHALYTHAVPTRLRACAVASQPAAGRTSIAGRAGGPCARARRGAPCGGGRGQRRSRR